MPPKRGTKRTMDQMDQHGTGNTSKFRAYCFTINNYDHITVDQLIAFFKAKKSLKRYMFQEEIGEECGTPHLQGVVEFESQISFNAIRACTTQKGHWEKARDILKSYWYCCKDATRKPRM